MLLCDDMFFPEASPDLVLQGAEILVSLSAWSKGTPLEPAYYSSLDELLDRVRATENQCWFVYSNRGVPPF